VRSTALSALNDGDVWLKLESDQPSASFKLYGMGLACERAAARGAELLVTSSGGNAGYAVAVAGRALGLPTTVVVPGRTAERMRGLIAAEGAEVLVHGDVWDDAHAYAERLAAEQGGAYVHPFDDPDVWEGHASLVREVAEVVRPEVVVAAVGGGGLLAGVVQGMHEVGWHDVPVLAVETEGAASYARALAAGAPVTLASIDTIALTMGAKRVCQRVVDLAGAHPIRSVLVRDDAAVAALRRFADDQRVLVEPACGAVLSLVYDGHPEVVGRSVLVVVCGGASVTLAQLAAWCVTTTPSDPPPRRPGARR
jgi:L-serine/L-threonine ammonia-lyase